MTKQHRARFDRTRQVFFFSLCALSAAILGACGDSGDTLVTNANPSVATVAGKVTYDYVPTAVTVDAAGTALGGLDYSKTGKRPVRRALVELVSEDGATVLAQTATDETGAYSVAMPAGKRAYVRVIAQASEGANNLPDYAIGIRDNTAPEYKGAPDKAPLYSMRGGLFTTTSTAMKLDLNAGSGWSGASYGLPRTAAPFAILDQTVNAAQKLRRAEPKVSLPALNVFWSVNNRPTSGDLNSGFVSTSHWQDGDAATGLYILGAENVDTDEYDASVLVHEFGHYVESSVSRSDSMGGIHGAGDLLDMRVAFGEAFGNAFSSMIRETPVYTDTLGPKQAQLGIYMRLDQVTSDEDRAWFNEFGVGNFLYLASQSADIGFASLYHALLGGEITTPALTSVFSFATALRPGLTEAGTRKLDALLADIHVQAGNALDAWGTRTTFRGDQANANPAVFPIYLPLTSGQSVTACTTTQFGTGNKLGNYRHLRVTVPAAGKYRFTPTADESGVDDYAVIAYAAGKPMSEPHDGPSASLVDFPAAGDYAADLVSQSVAEGTAEISTAPHCISLSMQSVNP